MPPQSPLGECSLAERKIVKERERERERERGGVEENSVVKTR